MKKTPFRPVRPQPSYIRDTYGLTGLNASFFTRNFINYKRRREISQIFDSRIPPQSFYLSSTTELTRRSFMPNFVVCLLQQQNYSAMRISSKTTACENLTSLLSSSSLCKLPFSYLATLKPRTFENSSCVKFRRSRIARISSG